MTNQEIPSKKPRLWLRLIFVVLLICAIFAAIAYVKYGQIQVLIEAGSQPEPPISVTVASAEPEQWNRKIKAIGTLVAYQGVDITTEESGIITSISFDSGDEVEDAALLIELDNRTEMANLESARARYDSDNSQYQRLLKLKDQSFVTKNDIDNQASQVDISEAQVSVAKAALSKKRIYAPFSGTLGIRQVDIGEYIAPGSTVVTLLSLDRLYLDFTLPERYFNDLIAEQNIRFQVKSYPDKTFNAKVETWNPELDRNTRNIQVRAVVDNRERLLAPGMFTDMNLTSQQKIEVLALPETAIFYNIYGEAVYVLEETPVEEGSEELEYRLAAKQVSVVYRQNGKAGISSGLEAGDLAVTSGQLKLFPSLKVAIVDDVPDYPSGNQN
ncbi:MAG: efflux RND transporter periplasmic adaptor subunit [Pseudomonadota bacterium]